MLPPHVHATSRTAMAHCFLPFIHLMNAFTMCKQAELVTDKNLACFYHIVVNELNELASRLGQLLPSSADSSEW